MVQLYKDFNSKQKPTQETQAAATLPEVMFEKYQTIERIGSGPPMRLFKTKAKKNANKINNFREIGWSDPFAE